MSIEQKIQQILAESQKDQNGQMPDMDENPAAALTAFDAAMDPLAQMQIEPNNARNNVDRQDLPEVEKDENEHTENAAPAEPSKPLAFKEDIDVVNETTEVELRSKINSLRDELEQEMYKQNNAGSVNRHYGRADDITHQLRILRAQLINHKAGNYVVEVPGNRSLSQYKEDIDALVHGEELTEEFKQKAATIFEAAVMTRVKQEVARLDEAYQAQLDERVEEIKEGLVEKVDGYLDYVVEQWMKDNEIALERGMKSEILEGFVSGLKGLFEQHYIEVPDEKFDVLGSMQEQIEGLSQKLDEQVEANIQLRNKLTVSQAEKVVHELAEGLTATDKDKFLSLVEELEFEGLSSFTKKAQTIRENYFAKKTAAPVAKSYVVSDEPVILSEETTRQPAVAPQMATYLNVLNNLIK